MKLAEQVSSFCEALISYRSLRIITEIVKFLLGRTPVFVDLDEDFQIDMLVEEFLKRLPRLSTYFLQGYSLMADDDALL